MLDAKQYALTGGDGFLGWHTKLAAHANGATTADIPVGDYLDPDFAVETLESSDVLIHLAGVNRGSDAEVADGNRRFAQQMADVLRACENPPAEVVYSNSIQALNGGIYGDAKTEAGNILAGVCEELGLTFRPVLLPNVFGEHGRPFYNSVVATFSHLLATGEGDPEVKQDRELTLIHAQNVADWLIGAIDEDEAEELFETASVSEVLAILREFRQVYAAGHIPDVSTPFRRDLFNTYRSYLASERPESIPLHLVRHADNRGSFFEVVRSLGGTGQSSFSTTEPGVSRGDHYHRRKIERFAVLSGSTVMRLRRMFTDEVLEFEVDGDDPAAIDMPTGWTHNLTNTGDDTLYMHFWTDDLFDPANPDTIPEAVVK